MRLGLVHRGFCWARGDVGMHKSQQLVRCITGRLKPALLPFLCNSLEVNVLPPACELTTSRLSLEALPTCQWWLPLTRTESSPPDTPRLSRGGWGQSPSTKGVGPHTSPFPSPHDSVTGGCEGATNQPGDSSYPCSQDPALLTQIWTRS